MRALRANNKEETEEKDKYLNSYYFLIEKIKVCMWNKFPRIYKKLQLHH
jgi:hypothetical protein